MNVAQTLVDPEALRERIAHALVPSTVLKSFDDASQNTTASLASCGRNLRSSIPRSPRLSKE